MDEKSDILFSTKGARPILAAVDFSSDSPYHRLLDEKYYASGIPGQTISNFLLVK